MAINFPPGTTIGQQHTDGINKWTWNGVAWVTSNSTIIGATGFSGATGATPASGSPKALTILEPAAGSNVTLTFTVGALTLSSVNVVLANGSSTPSVTFSLLSGTSRGTVATTNVNAQTVTSSTTPTSVTIANSSVAANSFIWISITAVSGTVPEFHLTISY